MKPVDEIYDEYYSYLTDAIFCDFDNDDLIQMTLEEYKEYREKNNDKY